MNNRNIQNKIVKAMEVIQMEPNDFYQQQSKYFGFKKEPTQNDINESVDNLVGEMIHIGLILNGVKNGALFSRDIMTPEVIKKYKDIGFHIHRWNGPQDTLIFMSRKDPNKYNWKNHVTVGKYLSYMTPGDLDEMYKIPNDMKYIVGINIYYKYYDGPKRKTTVMPQIAVDRTKKQIKEYLQPFLDVLNNMPTPKELEIIKVVPVIYRN